MRQKQKPASKIPTTQTNTNRKKKVQDSGTFTDAPSLLKKNEFTLIIAGALVVTVIAFFLFFRSSGPSPERSGTASVTSAPPVTAASTDLAGRLDAIEAALRTIQTSQSPSTGSSDTAADSSRIDKSLAKVQQQVSRLEASVSLKVDSLNERLGKLEKKVAAVKKATAAAASVKTAAVEKASPAKKNTPAKPVVVTTDDQKAGKNKASASDNKKASIFHTVKKGETLWSISQKYKTTVAKIRKLNNLSADAKIYPGSNILVR